MEGPINCTTSELSTFLQALGAGYLPISYSETAPSAPLKSIPIATKSYQHGRQTVAFPGFQSLLTLRNLTEGPGRELSMRSAADFPVRISAPPEAGPGSRASAPASGGNLRESFARFDRATSSWKTLQYSLLGGLEPFSGTWPRWGTMRNGESSERTMPPGLLAIRSRITSAIESGSLVSVSKLIAMNGETPEPAALRFPTPLASDGEKGGPNQKGGKGDLRLPSAVAQTLRLPTPPVASATGGQICRGGDRKDELLLAGAVKHLSLRLPTPTAAEFTTGDREKLLSRREKCKADKKNGNGFGLTLGNAMVALRLPTPTVCGNYNRRGASTNSGDGLATVVSSVRLPTPRNNTGADTSPRHLSACGVMKLTHGDTAGQLNPDFVEWMMNWPVGWTSLEPLPAGAMEVWRERTHAGTWWQHPPEVPGMAAGIARRQDRIRAIGNGQVPAALLLAKSYLAP